jgi:cytochrome c-type biogenesis protein CcmE
VRYAQCIVPDTFRDIPGMDVSVTAEGTLAASGDFEATQIMAKCPSKYEMRDRANKGEQAPHNAMMPPAALAN